MIYLDGVINPDLCHCPSLQEEFWLKRKKVVVIFRVSDTWWYNDIIWPYCEFPGILLILKYCDIHEVVDSMGMKIASQWENAGW